MAGSFKFSLGGVDHKLGKFDNKVERAIFAVAGFYAPKAEAWMKQNAPWTDRTTNARNGLVAIPFFEKGRAGYILAHSVSYGIFLELPRKLKKRLKRRRKKGANRRRKNYPIIVPALDFWGPRTMKKLTRLLDRLS